MSNNNLSEVVLFGVESVFSFLKKAEKVTPDQMLDHLAGELKKKYGLSDDFGRICKPFYWGLVRTGHVPGNEQPFFLKSEWIGGDPHKSVNYIALKEGVDLSLPHMCKGKGDAAEILDKSGMSYPLEVIYAANEVMTYRETLKARIDKASTPAQTA